MISQPSIRETPSRRAFKAAVARKSHSFVDEHQPRFSEILTARPSSNDDTGGLITRKNEVHFVPSLFSRQGSVAYCNVVLSVATSPNTRQAEQFALAGSSWRGRLK